MTLLVKYYVFMIYIILITKYVFTESNTIRGSVTLNCKKG